MSDRTIQGHLKQCYNTVCSDAILCIREYKDNMSIKQHCPIKTGDFLTVFNDESKKNIIWQGFVDLETDKHRNTLIKTSLDQNMWEILFKQNYPAVLTQAKAIQPKYNPPN